ncbi:MAG: hypothetical protein J5851_01140 [Oscillospiraceae bacterium]|nr:hypothetical protein [Oscillospiraceae bacterium]
MPLFGGYEQSGPGIAKDAPKKKPFFRFWEIVGRKFWKLLELNLLMMCLMIPLAIGGAAILLLSERNTTAAIAIMSVMGLVFAVLFGPWMAGTAQVLRKFTLEKPCFMMQTFFRAFKSSFKQACPMGLIDLLVLSSAASGSYVYPLFIQRLKETGESGSLVYYILFIAALSIAFVVIMMSFYAYLMMVSTDLSFKNIMKNSLALTFIALKRNLLTLLLAGLVMVVFTVLAIYFPYIMIFVLLFMPSSFAAFIVVFNSYPVIQKYVVDPYYAQLGEVNPEMSFTETEGENVFEDQGGKEKPIEAPASKKKSRKGKIVS